MRSIHENTFKDDLHGKKQAVDASEAVQDAKLTIKVGEHEIHLEARPEIVRQELDRLVDRLLPTATAVREPAAREPAVVSVTVPRSAAGKSAKGTSPKGAVAPPSTATAPSAVKPHGGKPPTTLDVIVQARGRQMIQPGAEKLLAHTTLDPGRLATLYAVDPRGRVLLKKLPATVDQLRDTVLLLLYGALTMRGESSENGFRLVQGVRSMGLRIERVPRELGAGSDLVNAFGRRRSKRYRLTTTGIQHCEKLIPGLLRTLEG